MNDEKKEDKMIQSTKGKEGIERKRKPWNAYLEDLNKLPKENQDH